MLVPSVLAKPFDFVPLALIEHFARRIFGRVLKIHPELFERLGAYRTKRFCFSPSDLPLHFVVIPEGRMLEVSRGVEQPTADAAISGPLLLLLALLEGRCDGDALFFSRDLMVTGEMEAMLALRNALDDSVIDLPAELGGMAGPLAPLVTGAVRYIRSRTLQGKTW